MAANAPTANRRRRDNIVNRQRTFAGRSDRICRAQTRGARIRRGPGICLIEIFYRFQESVFPRNLLRQFLSAHSTPQGTQPNHLFYPLSRKARSITSGQPKPEFYPCRSVQHTSQYLPNLRPFSLNTPTTLNLKCRCSASLAAFGSVYPATNR